MTVGMATIERLLVTMADPLFWLSLVWVTVAFFVGCVQGIMAFLEASVGARVQCEVNVHPEKLVIRACAHVRGVEILIPITLTRDDADRVVVTWIQKSNMAERMGLAQAEKEHAS